MAPKCVGATLAAVVAGAFPGPIGAQSARFTYGATMDGAATYDDNIYFERHDPEAGSAIRFRPTVDLGYRASRDVTFDGTYSFVSDIYPTRSELNDLFANQLASLGARVALDPRLSAHLSGSWSYSNTSSDIVGSGLELGRIRGTSWGGQAGLSRRMSAHGSLALDYSYQVVSFEDDPSTRAQSVTLGWTQEVTARTGVALSVGPRIVDGGTSTEISASIRHQLEHASLSLAYGRSRYPAPGQEVDTENLSATAQIPLSRTVSVSASPGFYRHRFGDDESPSHSWRMLLVTSWQLRPSVTARATYQHVRQDALPEQRLAAQRGPWIARNLFAISFTAGVGRPRGTSVNTGIGPMEQGPTR